MAEREAPRDVSFCGHTILRDGFLHVPDARKDPRFADSPIFIGEPHVRFYVDATLTSSDGYPVGTLCLIDTVPREFSEKTLRPSVILPMQRKRELSAQVRPRYTPLPIPAASLSTKTSNGLKSTKPVSAI